MFHDVVLRERYNSHMEPDNGIHCSDGLANTQYRAHHEQREWGVHSDITNNRSVQNTIPKVLKHHSVPRTNIPYVAGCVVHESPHRSNHPKINTVHCIYQRLRQIR